MTSTKNAGIAVGCRSGEWDESLFPAVIQAGQMMGNTTTSCQQAFGLPAGIPVSIAGHDHVCAAAALSAASNDLLVDSMGTAETLVGDFADHPLTENDFKSGLSYGNHVLPGKKYWMGALSTSGGALEWVSSIFGHKLTYAEIEQEVESLPDQPGQIVFVPYLSGSGAPHSNPALKGAWLGLRNDQTQAHLIKAVLEGTACEMEYIRQAAKAAGLLHSEKIIVTGGGALNHSWLKIKADISGTTLTVKSTAEAALIGAGMAAGVAAKVFPDFRSGTGYLLPAAEETISPDPESSKAYRQYFKQRYLPAMQLIQRFTEDSNQLEPEE